MKTAAVTIHGFVFPSALSTLGNAIRSLFFKLTMSKQFITIGQRISCGFHWAGRGIVYAIHGEQNPQSIKTLAGGAIVSGGRASFDVVFDNGHDLRQVSEAIIRGVQWRILWEKPLASMGEIQDALNFAEAERIREKTEETLQKDALETERERIRKEHGAFLKPVAPGEYSTAALGSKNLKKELTRAFPCVKFSVKSDTYSGGDAIRVSWTRGPTTKQVEEISNKYQEGSFNSMEDLYETDRENVWPEVFGGAKYVSESRHFPEDLREAIMRGLCELEGVAYEGQYTRLPKGEDVSHEAWQLYARTAFAPGVEFVGVERWKWTPETDPEHHWCRITFTSEAWSETPQPKNPERVPQTAESAAQIPLLTVPRAKAPKIERLRRILAQIDASIAAQEAAPDEDYDYDKIVRLENRRASLEKLAFPLEQTETQNRICCAKIKPAKPSNVIAMPIQSPAAGKLAAARAAILAL